MVTLEELVKKENEFVHTRMEFVRNSPDLVGACRTGLTRPVSRGTVLRLLDGLQRRELNAQLVDEILELSLVGHSDVALCRKVLLTIDQALLTERINSLLPRIRKQGGEEENRRIAEFLKVFDPELLKKHVQALLNSDSDELKEIGRDFDSNTN